MHVLIATDGSIDVGQAVPFATALAGDDGKTTVATVVKIPRRLVQDLNSNSLIQPFSIGYPAALQALHMRQASPLRLPLPAL